MRRGKDHPAGSSHHYQRPRLFAPFPIVQYEEAGVSHLLNLEEEAAIR
jgi:hypothetical protein